MNTVEQKAIERLDAKLSSVDEADGYVPYVYVLGWKSKDRYYIGVQHRRSQRGIANPVNIWTDYFTSSYYVRAFAYLYGDPDVIVTVPCSSGDQAAQLEQEVQQRLSVISDRRFLNKAIAGAFIFDEETRKKMSAAKIGSKNPMWNRQQTEGAKAKLRAAHLGKPKRPHTDAERARISAQQAGENNAFFGKKHSEETRALMRARHAERRANGITKTRNDKGQFAPKEGN